MNLKIMGDKGRKAKVECSHGPQSCMCFLPFKVIRYRRQKLLPLAFPTVRTLDICCIS